MWNSRFDRVPHAAEVDVDHVLPDIFPNLVQPGAIGADACIRDDDVEPAELFDAAVHCGLQCLEIADIDLLGDDATAVALTRSTVSARSSGVECG